MPASPARPDPLRSGLRFHLPAAVLGDALEDARSDHVEVGLRLADAEAGLEARDDGEPVGAAKVPLLALHRQGNQALPPGAGAENGSPPA